MATLCKVTEVAKTPLQRQQDPLESPLPAMLIGIGLGPFILLFCKKEEAKGEKQRCHR
jgi:hypothetical protein